MDIKVGAILAETEEGIVPIPAFELILSERNLRTLLTKLDDPEYGVSRYTEAGILLTIRGESNEVHYADRPAGLMDEATEELLIREELGDENETLYLPEGFGQKLDD